MLKRLLKKVFTNELLIEPAEFVIKVAMVYAIWRGFKYCGETYPGFLWGGWAAFYDIVGNLLASADSVILNLLDVRHLHDKRVIIVEGTNGIKFSDLCLGIAPMFIYSGFILAFGNNVHINLEPDTKAETKALFDQLSAGGVVTMPLQVMFWGAYYGSCTDKFGVHWMFNCTGE